jgi:hypothetical protein
MFAPIAAAMIAAATFSPFSSNAWVCRTLDTNPSVDGVNDLILEAYGRGYSTEADGEMLVQVVVADCPEYIPLLMEWADDYNG